MWGQRGRRPGERQIRRHGTNADSIWFSASLLWGGAWIFFFLDGCCDSCTSKDITVMCIPMNRCEFGFNWCQIQSVLNVAAAREHTLTQRAKNAMHGSFHQPLRRSVLFSLICCIYSSFVVILHIKEMGRQRRLCCPWQDATEFRK